MTTDRAPAEPARSGLIVAARRLVPLVVFGVLPLALVAAALAGDVGVHYAGDFHYSFWPAGDRVLHGTSPYLEPDAPEVAKAIAFVYPAVGALMLTPFALIPREVADAVFTGLNLVAVLLALRLLGVRDWRIYGTTLMVLPVLSGWSVGNVTLILGLGIAALWRYRDRPVAAGALAATLVSFKVFLWPLALWLLATRRVAASAWMVLFGVVGNLVAWTILGFDEIGRYRRLVKSLADQRDDLGYSVVSIALREGVARSPSYALAAMLAFVVAGAAVYAAHRGQEVGALALTILLCFLATPIVQIHYFALLLLPLALAVPRLRAVWALPLVYWLCADGSVWQASVALMVTIAIVAVCLRYPGRGAELQPV